MRDWLKRHLGAQVIGGTVSVWLQGDRHNVGITLGPWFITIDVDGDIEHQLGTISHKSQGKLDEIYWAWGRAVWGPPIEAQEEWVATEEEAMKLPL